MTALRAALSDWVRVSRFCKESWADFLRRPLVERAYLGIELAAFLEPEEDERGE